MQPDAPAASRAGRACSRLTRALPLLGVAAACAALWALVSLPVAAPPWPDTVRGYAFSPLRAGDDPARERLPPVESVGRDLALLAAGTHSVRTYAADGSLAAVPRLASRHGLAVTLGVRLNGDASGDGARLERALALAARHDSVQRLLVGNEVLLRGDLDPGELIPRLDDARRRARVPVSTAEPWHVWLRHPELAAHVDFIAVHVLPYWEGVALEHAVDHVGARLAEVRHRFPGKPVLLAEVGWPSEGRPRGGAVASRTAQATFLRRFLERAGRERWDYFVVEAFDQPWKRRDEGAVGAYWGVHDVQRVPKFAFSGAVLPVPAWPALAALSTLLALLLLRLLTRDGARLAPRGRLFLGALSVGVATSAVWVAHGYLARYLTATDLLTGGLLAASGLAVIAVLLAEAHEWAEARWGRRGTPPSAATASGRLPRVSVHVPVHDEPPELVARTLRALSALDYPDYEVLVVDNNTADPARWQPLQRLCRELGARFGFVHVEGLAGYKAGALNLALRHTDPVAEVVAVVDSDYAVDPGWLRDLAPHFACPDLAVVQAPQDYRDADESLFKAFCEAEYRGFFHLGMVTRNERNAIIQHGTMTLVRREALERAGGWAEWTVTEDAELGLRLLERGWRMLYVPRSYGRGVTPDSFVDFKRQRHRWALGAVQILRAHAATLFDLRDRRLAAGQRYHFVAGWLPWLADGLSLLFSLAAIGWCAGMVAAPLAVDPPLVVFSALPLVLFGFRLLKLFCLYRATVRAGLRDTLGAALAGLALSHTVGRAVLAGLRRREHAFVRTPKFARREGLGGALLATGEEAALALALVACALAVGVTQPMAGLDVHLWQAVLLVQAAPCLAAVALSLLAALPARRGLPAAEGEGEAARA